MKAKLQGIWVKEECLIMSNLKTVKVAFCFPGQAIAVWPKVETFKEREDLAKIVEAHQSAFEDAVGKELATAALQADSKQLEADTLLGQLRSFFTTSTVWLLFLNYSQKPGQPTPASLMQEGLLEMQLVGDSAGFNSAGHAPGPGPLDDQLAKLREGARNTRKRGELMLETPHDYAIGGMAATMGLSGGVINAIVKRVNRQLKHENLVQVVKHNAPKIKVVAGPREGLELLAQYVAAKKGKSQVILPYWFHHSLAMELAGGRYGIYLAGKGVFTPPSPLLTHASYVTGKVVRPAKLVTDIAQGVWQPVFFYTARGPSVHGAMHRNGYHDVIVLNSEVRNWLRDSPKVATHLMNDLASMAGTYNWLMQVMKGDVQPGKQLTTVPASPSPQLSRSSPYLAQR